MSSRVTFALCLPFRVHVARGVSGVLSSVGSLLSGSAGVLDAAVDASLAVSVSSSVVPPQAVSVRGQERRRGRGGVESCA